MCQKPSLMFKIVSLIIKQLTFNSNAGKGYPQTVAPFVKVIGPLEDRKQDICNDC